MKGEIIHPRTEHGSSRKYFSLFSESEEFSNSLLDLFIINRPLHAVGGDGYWLHQGEQAAYVAVFDCVGNGHMGSMITRIYAQTLKKAVVQRGISEPGEILLSVHKEIQEAFRKKVNSRLDTSAEVGIVKVDMKHANLEFAGGGIDLIEVKKGVANKLKADEWGVGGTYEPSHYATHTISNHPGSTFYMTSDGLKNLVGGPHNKKLGMENAKKLLEEMSRYPIAQQKDLINTYLHSWSGHYSQLDDVLILGFMLNR